jgi:FtsZ-binding cell division protein ZapB
MEQKSSFRSYIVDVIPDHKIISTIILFSLLLLFSACKHHQIVTENVATEIDSTAVWYLKEELNKREVRVDLLQTELQRTKDENINLRNEISKHEIYYDTKQPVDTTTGKPPVSSEIITISRSWFEKLTNEYDVLLQESRKENKNLTRKNSNLQLTIENLINENKKITEQSTPSFNFKIKLLLSSLSIGLLLSVLVYFAFRNYK